MKSPFLFFIFLLFFITSCENNDQTEELPTFSYDRTEELPTFSYDQTEELPTFSNDTLLNTRSLLFSQDIEQNINFVSRYYRWENAYDANHHYSLETPSGTNNSNYIEYGLKKSFFGKEYTYEGLSFYTFKYYPVRLFSYSPDLALYSVYLPESNNTILYTLKPGATDPYLNYSIKSHLGYVVSDPAYSYGLVAIREYYSKTEKDYLYISDDVTFTNMGYISGNYSFTKIIGYTLQSYRISPYYYNFFNVTIDTDWVNDFNKYGVGSMLFSFKTEVIDSYGNASGAIVTSQSKLMDIDQGYGYYFYVSPTRDILESEMYIYYYDSKGNKQRLSLGNFYFSNNFPNASSFSYTKSTGFCNFKVEFKRTALNMWNIHLSKAN